MLSLRSLVQKGSPEAPRPEEMPALDDAARRAAVAAVDGLLAAATASPLSLLPPVVTALPSVSGCDRYRRSHAPVITAPVLLRRHCHSRHDSLDTVPMPSQSVPAASLCPCTLTCVLSSVRGRSTVGEASQLEVLRQQERHARLGNVTRDVHVRRCAHVS
jgi:hypothetical protein